MVWNPLRLDRSDSLPAPILLVVLTAVLSAGLTSLVWWSTRQPAPPRAAPPPPAPVVDIQPDPTLRRADLIALANAAASAFAAGATAPDQSAAVGKPFELRMAFACGAPDLTLVRDVRQKSLKLTARLQDWTAGPAVKALGGEGFDRVEGFWLPRPWIAAETCRTRSLPMIAATSAVDRVIADPDTPPPEPPAPAVQTLGLASFFPTGSNRAQQRAGKPYETVQKLGGELGTVTEADLFMVVRGRIGQAAEGRPVICQGPAVDHRPVCLLAVDIERVAFERAGPDKPIAEWAP